MKAIRKKPGCEPELVEEENTLKALQTEVGGYMEPVWAVATETSSAMCRRLTS